jgi:XTP/dITP diphosphohydrolase/tetrapyrrole methylase family protein/MazG family protein
MSAVDDLRRTVARLRAPDGCPWDREQTHQSLAVCLVEECAELLDTIDRLDMPHMREELGDVLIQVVFHAQLAEEKGLFDLEAVAAEINEKLIRRHPHVFGTGKADTSDQVISLWEKIKATEKKNGSQPVAAGVFKRQPPALPSLLVALEVYKQIHKKKLPAEGLIDEPRVERLAEGLTEADAGHRLFELAAACRKAGIDPESALRRETSRITRTVEERAAAAKPVEQG